MATNRSKQVVKHTRGFFSVEDEGHLEHEGFIWIVDQRGLCVAEIEACDEATIGTEEAAANADLLAAAPDLLAASRALRDALAKGDPQYTLNAEEGAALNALDAAILKATEGK